MLSDRPSAHRTENGLVFQPENDQILSMLSDTGFQNLLNKDLFTMMVDSEGKLIYANANLLSVGGWSWPAIVGKIWYELWVPQEVHQRVAQIFPAHIYEGQSKPSYFESPFVAKDGQKRTIVWASQPRYDQDNRLITVSSVGIDITNWITSHDQDLLVLNLQDRLTGLASQESFRGELAKQVDNANTGAHHIAVLLVDIDRFRHITEAVGHEATDLLLQEIAQRVAKAAGNFTVARISGDEFAILANEISGHSEAIGVAEKLIAELQHPLTSCATEFYVGASVGIALYPRDAATASHLLRNASMALHQAKAAGGHQYAVYRSGLSDQAKTRMTLEHQLRGAIARKELSLYYQPQVDAKCYQIIGLEALARWHHPILGEVSPTQFIPIAEDTGIINELGLWILWEACSQVKRWRSMGLPPITVAVNISAKQLTNLTLVDDVKKVLKETGMPPELLELEVTESALMSNIEVAAQVLNELRQMGISISLDDFGTGYSCISHLQELAVNVIKVDKAFVQAVPSMNERAALVNALVNLGHNLNLRVIAEGIETMEQLARLQNASQLCDAYQGYFFSHPLPGNQIAELLRQNVVLPLAV